MFACRAAIRFFKLNSYTTFWEKTNATVAKRFVSVAKRHPHKVAYYFEDEAWSFKKVGAGFGALERF